MENTKLNLEKPTHDICKKIIGEQAVEIKKIETFGDVNVVYSVVTEKRKYVFRLNTEDGIEQFLKEVWCMDVANEKGILTTSIIHYGEHEGIAFMIQPFIEGVNGSEFRNKVIIWEALGSYARQVHQIKPQGFGGRMFEPGIFAESWQRYVQYNIESLNPDDKLLELKAFDQSIQSKLKKVFEGLATQSFNFGLCHGDISTLNTIVDKDNKTWLIDWGSAEAHIVPHFDFMFILKEHLTEGSELFKVFLKGYGMGEDEFKAMKPALYALTLLIATDKVRYAIDRAPDKIEEFTMYLRQVIANRE
jgi:aminoglycoside phosphotransferase (APT) family kinase protein